MKLEATEKENPNRAKIRLHGASARENNTSSLDTRLDESVGENDSVT